MDTCSRQHLLHCSAFWHFFSFHFIFFFIPKTCSCFAVSLHVHVVTQCTGTQLPIWVNTSQLSTESAAAVPHCVNFICLILVAWVSEMKAGARNSLSFCSQYLWLGLGKNTTRGRDSQGASLRFIPFKRWRFLHCSDLGLQNSTHYEQ